MSMVGAACLHEERVLPREPAVLVSCPGAEEGAGHRVQDQEEGQGDLGVSHLFYSPFYHNQQTYVIIRKNM
jgi:hypothetical protein